MSYQVARLQKICAAGSVLALAMLVLPLHAGNQDAAKEPPKARGPVPEMTKLAFYVGDWDYTETYEKSPAYPNGGQNTGVYNSTLGPGGNSLVQHFHSKGPVGDFEGMIVITWDPKEKAYKSYIFGDAFSGAVVETGQWEGDALVFKGIFEMGEMKIGLRNVTRLTAPGHIQSEEYVAMSGQEALMLKVDAKKR